MKDRHYDSQKEKGQKNKQHQDTTQKTKYWITGTPQQLGGEVRCSGNNLSFRSEELIMVRFLYEIQSLPNLETCILCLWRCVSLKWSFIFLYIKHTFMVFFVLH
jgi:hypothetical protein